MMKTPRESVEMAGSDHMDMANVMGSRQRTKADVAKQDEEYLARLGKKQRFKRNFGGLSITGLACTLMLTWEGSILTFGPQLLNGGPAGLVGGSILAWGGTVLQVLVMAEMASAIPLSGGQYNWVAAFAPPRWSRFLSYLTGWQAALTWNSAVAVIVYISALSIQTLAIISHPTYEPKMWQLVLIMYSVIALALLINTYLGRVLPLLESLVLFVHVFGFFVVLIVLLYLTKHKNPSSLVFGDFINGGGWSTNTLSFFVGLVSSILTFQGVEAGAHLAEEVSNASVTVPWSMLASVMVNGATGFAMVLTLMYVMGDPLSVVNAYLSGQLPFATIFKQALGSNGAVTGLTVIPVFVTIFGAVGAITTASRMMWALARENALPASNWISKIQPKNALPLNAVFIVVVIDVLLALINLGSTTAFNAFAGMVVQGYLTSFIIVAGCGLYWRLSKSTNPAVPEPGPFRLGIFGIPITIIALIYSIIGLFFSLWPPVPNPTVPEFNWSLVAWVGTLIVSLIYWQLRARHKYVGPLTEINNEHEVEETN